VIRLAALLLAALLAVAGCGAGDHRTAEVVVGAQPDSESRLLADIYVSALRGYGFAARTETAADPMAKLDSGAFTVVPAFTGQVLRRLKPGVAVTSDSHVYRVMISMLPEGIVAGDYTTSAEDKPVLVVTPATVATWGGGDLNALHCDGLVVGMVAGASAVHPPPYVGPCRMPAPREFPDGAAMLAALRAGELTAAWTTTADPGIAPDLVALSDVKPPLIQAENVVPLYRRNALNARQLLALNEVAGVLDTAALADMRRQVAGGADPQAVADAWLGEHPLGRS
jgi:glycine betaine/choline ABC-type transport system substrate-binding protein